MRQRTQRLGATKSTKACPSWPARRCLAVAALAVFALGAGQRAPQPRPDLVWPPPPDPARVRFVRSLDPLSARGRPSLFSRLARVIVGRTDDPAMQQPYGIAVGPDRRVYVADTTGRALHVYTMDTPGYSTIKVDGDSLIGVAVAAGRIYVTDSVSGRVICLDARGRTLWTRGTRDGFLRPTGIAASSDRIYVVDTLRHRVTILSPAGDVLEGFGEHGTGPGQFNFPTNIARGADGRLYVADTMNFRVEIFDRDGRFLRTFGQLGDGSGDFARAKGIGVDSENHVYVVDGLNDVVQVFDEDGQLLLGFGESGSGDGQFWLPTGLAVVDDVIYVADSANKRFEVFEYLGGRR